MRGVVYTTSELAVVMTHSDHSREPVHMFKFITRGELESEVLAATLTNSQLELPPIATMSVTGIGPHQGWGFSSAIDFLEVASSASLLKPHGTSPDGMWGGMCVWSVVA